jgi:cytoskeletal protein CcmA (bactofilin family)
MFNAKTKAPLSEVPLGSTTIIGVGTVINGNIESNNDIRIDGSLIGNITSKTKILIGTEGSVTGDIKCQQADVAGKITGKLKVTELLQLNGKSNVKGDIYAGKLQIDPSATFNGQCHMGANIVELNAEMGNVISR